MSLILPGGRQLRPVLTVPRGDLRLKDGRYLRRQGQTLGRDPESPQTAVLDVWFGPKALRVLASLDQTKHGPLLHVSLSYPHHDPDWDTIRQVRAVFYPEDWDVMLVLPRTADFINLHGHCFHLWECPVGWEIQ